MAEGQRRRNAVSRLVATSPTGQEYTPPNFQAFCREHDLNYRHMGSVVKGLTRHYKGWTCRYADPEIAAKYQPREPLASRTNSHTYLITAPDGKTYTTRQLTKFCREHGLTREAMGKVARGLTKSHRGGWTCQYQTEIQI